MAFIVVLMSTALAQAQTFTTLFNFTGGADGGSPNAGLVQDPSGNLYGTTVNGGSGHSYRSGVVYELDPVGTETVLHSFGRNPEGGGPATPEIRDNAGNIYWTTSSGGNDCGVVFKIDSVGSESVQHTFTGSDGCGPAQGLVRDKAGNLYGTTAPLLCTLCSGDGTIFKVDNKGNFTLLHTFAGGSSDGLFPYYGHLTMDKSGNLYGVTWGGGAYGYGLLYKLSTSGKFTVLHSFNNRASDGC
jgi:uncharacterized repeat protein (TIGR03803 family)